MRIGKPMNKKIVIITLSAFMVSVAVYLFYSKYPGAAFRILAPLADVVSPGLLTEKRKAMEEAEIRKFEKKIRAVRDIHLITSKIVKDMTADTGLGQDDVMHLTKEISSEAAQIIIREDQKIDIIKLVERISKEKIREYISKENK